MEARKLTDNSGGLPRGRPPKGKKQSREELRQLALDVAQTVLTQEGSAALTIRRIAQEIGCAVGTIYNLFDDLDHLVALLNLVTLRELDCCLRDGLEDRGDDTPEARLLLLARTYVAFTERHGARWATVLEARASGSLQVRDDTATVVNGMVRLVDDEVRRLLPEGFEAADRWRVTVALWSGIEGIGRLTSTGNLDLIAPDTDAVNLIETQIVTFLYGLRGMAR